jgi:hypothetical protein
MTRKRSLKNKSKWELKKKKDTAQIVAKLFLTGLATLCIAGNVQIRKKQRGIGGKNET